jgi:hypothetical protein
VAFQLPPLEPSAKATAPGPSVRSPAKRITVQEIKSTTLPSVAEALRSEVDELQAQVDRLTPAPPTTLEEAVFVTPASAPPGVRRSTRVKQLLAAAGKAPAGGK